MDKVKLRKAPMKQKEIEEAISWCKDLSDTIAGTYQKKLLYLISLAEQVRDKRLVEPATKEEIEKGIYEWCNTNGYNIHDYQMRVNLASALVGKVGKIENNFITKEEVEDKYIPIEKYNAVISELEKLKGKSPIAKPTPSDEHSIAMSHLLICNYCREKYGLVKKPTPSITAEEIKDLEGTKEEIIKFRDSKELPTNDLYYALNHCVKIINTALADCR